LKLIVIGASGFIGGALYKKAVREGFETFGTGFKNGGTDLIRFDMLKDDIKAVLPRNYTSKPASAMAVICSANPLIEACKKNAEESYQLNVISMKRLITCLTELKIKFCFLSSDNVYNGLNGYHDESEPPSPCNEYGLQKAEIENYILKSCPQGLIFRLSQTVSDNVNEKQLFAQWNEWCITKKEIMCIKDNILSPTCVEDIFAALVAAFSKKASGLYNCVNGEHFSREELAHQFVRHLFFNAGIKITVKPASEFCFADKRALKTYLDNTKIVRELDIKFTSMKTVFRSIASQKNIL